MTREEAIAELKAFMENPLFSDAHKQAFNIAIHDIKQRHDWDINNLILINKENYEPAEQEYILDKIRTELAEKRDILVKEARANTINPLSCYGLDYALLIIDKYKGDN